MKLNNIKIIIFLYGLIVCLTFLPSMDLTGMAQTAAFAKDIHIVKYLKKHTIKEIYVVPQNPKRWGLLISDISNSIIFSNKYFLNYKIAVVAYGPVGIKFLMKKFNKKFYPDLQSFNSYGVKFIACNETMETLHIKKRELFKFADIVYPGVVLYIVKKEQQGYVYIPL
ncbi:MAG: DsrE family protein [bacterium]